MSTASVAYATSSDPRHPPTSVLDGSGTFWSSTGLFPQELALTWPSERAISRVAISACDGAMSGRMTAEEVGRNVQATSLKHTESFACDTAVRKVALEKSSAQQPDKYERIAETGASIVNTLSSFLAAWPFLCRLVVRLKSCPFSTHPEFRNTSGALQTEIIEARSRPVPPAIVTSSGDESSFNRGVNVCRLLSPGECRECQEPKTSHPERLEWGFRRDLLSRRLLSVGHVRVQKFACAGGGGDDGVGDGPVERHGCAGAAGFGRMAQCIRWSGLLPQRGAAACSEPGCGEAPGTASRKSCRWGFFFSSHHSGW